MTARARISQADMERALKAAKKAGWPHIRMVLDLANGTIELFVADTAEGVRASELNPLDRIFGDRWSDDNL